MGAELLAHWTFRVEAIEDRRQFVVGDSGSLILDSNLNSPSSVSCGEADLGERGAERHGIGNKVAKHLRQPGLDPGHDERAAAVGQLKHEVWRALCPGRLMEVGERLQHRRDIDRLHLETTELRVEAGCVRDVGYE